jgi:O-antigen/teichoic acid export membrane protein
MGSTNPSVAELITARRRPSFASWVGKGFLAVLDQGVTSGSNFLVSVCLARWLIPKQYGAYALALQGFFLVALVQEALLQEPMLVFGRSIYQGVFREYSRMLLRIYAVIAWGVMLVMGLSAWLVGALGSSGLVSRALAGAALASPGLLLWWLARRAFYARLIPGAALSGALFYAALIAGGLLIIYRGGLLSPFTALLLMGSAGLLVGSFQLMRLWGRLEIGNTGPTLAEVSRQHWGYGRWAFAAALLRTVPSSTAYYFLLGRLSGLVQVGALKALLNLTAPVTQVCGSFGLLSVPHAAETHHWGGRASLGRLVWKLTVLYAGGGIAYWTVVILFQGPILRFLYAGKYDLVAPLIPWLGLASTLAVIARAQNVAMRGMQSSFSVFAVQVASGTIDLVVGIPATVLLGLRGVVFTEILSCGAAVVVGLIMLRRALCRTSENRA